jgi:NADH-quinone oxidoreductase subunit K
MMITLDHFLVLGAALFLTGLAGVLMRRNIIVILVSLELMLNAVNINLVAFSAYLQDVAGQVFVFFVLAVAAAEAALGLALVVVLFRNRETVDVDDVNLMKG